MDERRFKPRWLINQRAELTADNGVRPILGRIRVGMSQTNGFVKRFNRTAVGIEHHAPLFVFLPEKKRER